MRLFSKRKSKEHDPEEPTRRQRFQEFGQRLNAADRERQRYHGSGHYGPPPPVDFGWERAERQAEEIDRKRAREGY